MNKGNTVGLDLGDRYSDVCVLDGSGAVVARDRVLMVYLTFGGKAATAIAVGERLLGTRPNDPLTLAAIR